MQIPLSKLSKVILRYLIFVGIPYLLAKRLEKIMVNRLDPELKARLNEELKKFPEEDVRKFPDIEDISEDTRAGLDNRGGAGPILAWLAKIVVADFAVKVAIAGAIGSTVWSDIADHAAGKIAKYGTALLNAPGTKFAKLVNKLRGIDPKYEGIKELLLDKDLTVTDKLELLQVKIDQTIKELKGRKRTKFILFVIAALFFFVGGGQYLPAGTSTAFAALMERLRALLGVNDNDEDIRKAIIEVYREYNAPLPQELIPLAEEMIPQAIKDAINGIE